MFHTINTLLKNDLICSNDFTKQYRYMVVI